MRLLRGKDEMRVSRRAPTAFTTLWAQERREVAVSFEQNVVTWVDGSGPSHRNCGLAPSGFEPLSPAPKASMLGHYTTGLCRGLGPPTKRIEEPAIGPLGVVPAEV